MNFIPLIVLLTDFGVVDPFVGILKGVIARIAPGVTVVDLTHEIPPGDVRRAAVVLWQAHTYFLAGTVFVCVVDPGVGTARRPILVQSGDYTYIGPDNGLFTLVLEEDFHARQLQNPAFRLETTSVTFHGRDIFAPAAAHFACGLPLAEFGPPLSELTRLSPPHLELIEDGSLCGEVLFPDRFGNLLTSLGCFQQREDALIFTPWLPGVEAGQLSFSKSRLRLPNGNSLSLAATFAEIPADKCAALVGSSGLLEIAANRQSAAALLGLHGGEILSLTV